MLLLDEELVPGGSAEVEFEGVVTQSPVEDDPLKMLEEWCPEVPQKMLEELSPEVPQKMLEERVPEVVEELDKPLVSLENKPLVTVDGMSPRSVLPVHILSRRLEEDCCWATLVREDETLIVESSVFFEDGKNRLRWDQFGRNMEGVEKELVVVEMEHVVVSDGEVQYLLY